MSTTNDLSESLNNPSRTNPAHAGLRGVPDLPVGLPKARAWIVKAYGDARAYRGNLGYSDDLGACYYYDNFVPNCRQVNVGDILLIRNKTGLVGVARVRDIDSWRDKKERHLCPKCRQPSIKYRKSTHQFSCQNGKCKNRFPEPEKKTVSCTRFVAHYEGDVVLFADGIPITPAAIQAASPSYNRQNAIVPIDIDRRRATLDASAGTSGALRDSRRYGL